MSGGYSSLGRGCGVGIGGIWGRLVTWNRIITRKRPLLLFHAAFFVLFYPFHDQIGSHIHLLSNHIHAHISEALTVLLPHLPQLLSRPMTPPPALPPHAPVPFPALHPSVGSTTSHRTARAGMQVGSSLPVLHPPPSAPISHRVLLIPPPECLSDPPAAIKAERPPGPMVARKPCRAAGRRSSPRRRGSAFFLTRARCHHRPCRSVCPARSRILAT